MPTIETKTGVMYFVDHRRDDSPYPPIILSHGAGGSHLDWPPQLRRAENLNLIAVDLPGHGKSPGPGYRSVSDYAAHIAALLDALAWPGAIIAGHSMGGAIAQIMALDYPDKVAGIILVGTGAKLRVHPDILDKVRVEPETVFTLLKEWLWGEVGVTDAMRDLSFRLLMETAPEVTHGDYYACDNFDIRDRIGEIAAPALIIGGTADKMTPHKYSVYLQEHIAGARLATIEGGGHMMALEQPEVIVAAIQQWLADTFPPY